MKLRKNVSVKHFFNDNLKWDRAALIKLFCSINQILYLSKHFVKTTKNLVESTNYFVVCIITTLYG